MEYTNKTSDITFQDRTIKMEINSIVVNQKWVKIPSSYIKDNIIINNILNRSIGIFIKNHFNDNIKMQCLFNNQWADLTISNIDLQDYINYFSYVKLINIGRCDIMLLIDEYIGNNIDKYIEEIIEVIK